MKHNAINKFGYRSGIVAFTATVLFYLVQLLQILDLLQYPLDEILIYSFSLCICLPFLLEMLVLHHVAPQNKKIGSHAALIFTVMYGVFVIANYVVQLATVIPMTIKGEGAGVQLLRQTPHSLFWDFDAIGYVFMGIATLCAVPVFGKSGFQKWVRYSFLAHSCVTPLIMFVYFYPVFSNRLLLLAMPWAITAPLAMIMLALSFKKNALNNAEVIISY